MPNLSNEKYVSFDKKKYQKLRAVYNKTVKEGKETFWFDGDHYFTDFTKYLLEYLEQKFK